MGLAIELKEAILETYDPEAIVLFGSLGRGDADEFSDVDLLLVMETGQDPRTLSQEIAESLSHLTEDKHIIVRTPETFCRESDIPGTIAFSAAREGKILFEKEGWRRNHLPVDSYEKRKQEILHKEYARSAYDFLAQAESALQGSTFFRCRDFARFAAVRAIKGLFVKHDMHPPRETDLVDLLQAAKALEAYLDRHSEFVRELNSYCPGKTDATEAPASRSMLDRTALFLKEVTVRYEQDRQG
jgi:predicted nucleotidyltransferase